MLFLFPEEVNTIGTMLSLLVRLATVVKGIKPREEAQMILFKQPKAPKHPTVSFAGQFWQKNKDNSSE
jgi:hypothetical protein